MKPIFQRRHYEFLAKVIRENEFPLVEVAGRIADEFSKDNDKFSRVKFMTACTGEKSAYNDEAISRNPTQNTNS